MDEDIGRCISRAAALATLNDFKKYIPADRIWMYVAALSRVRFEFRRHDPVKPVDGHCGRCGMPLQEKALYCWNCGKEVDNECEGDNYEYTTTDET